MKKNLLTIALALVAMFANAQDKVSTATTWDFESTRLRTSTACLFVVLPAKAMIFLPRFTNVMVSLPMGLHGRPV